MDEAEAEHFQATKDAIALTTALMHEIESGLVWTESYQLATELSETRAVPVMLAQAYFMNTTLQYVADVIAAVEAEGVHVAGVRGGSTPANILREIGRQILEAENEPNGD